LNYDYGSGVVPLRGTSTTSWWQVDQGGAIVPQDDVEFQSDPGIKKFETKWGVFEGESTFIPIHTALEELDEAGIKDVKIGFILKYTSTTGADEKIPIGTYQADLSNLREQDMRIHYAQENEEEKAKQIYDHLN
jgi:hypothetical protein